MKEVEQIAVSNQVVGQKRRRRRGGIWFSGAKQLRRSAMRNQLKKKETMSVDGEMGTLGQDRRSVQTDAVSPFRLRHLPRAVSLQALSERDEEDRTDASPASRDRVHTETQSEADSLAFDEANDDNAQEDEPKVRSCTIRSYPNVRLYFYNFLMMFV